MKNALKITIFTMLALLSVLLLVIYTKTSNEVYQMAAIACFISLFLIGLSNFAPEIAEGVSIIRKNFFRPEIKITPYRAESNELDGSWKKFIENNPIPSITFDQDLNILRKNKSFIDLLIKNKLDPDGLNIRDSFACDVERFKNAMVKSNYSASIEGEAILNNNVKTPFVFFSVPISTNKTEKVFFAQFVDNSESFDLKEKFIQAQKMQAIGQLAGGVAHDFNNLLTAIIGFCDLLLTRHAPGDSSFVDIMHIKQNANRAANLVRQLLAFSRKQTMQMDILHPSEVLTEISNLIRRLIGENISLSLNIDRDVSDIKADKSQLEQVLVNLAVNARDAMKNGGKLNINCDNVEIFSTRDIKYKYPVHTLSGDIPSGKYVMISFEDTGSGIAPENLKKIFEPFFTTKEVGHGTGLGLATVSGIIEQTGGFLAVSSEEGSGTEFLIFLKRYEKKVKETVPEEVKKEKSKDLTGTGTILIVEDEEPVRIFSSRALKNKGYNIYEAFSGENALEVIEKIGGKNIDLIVSDVVMPGISGPEMVEEIHRIYPDIKVIFVSGYGEDAFYQKYGTERKFNFLAKPYSLNQLAERVKEVLNS